MDKPRRIVVAGSVPGNFGHVFGPDHASNVAGKAPVDPSLPPNVPGGDHVGDVSFGTRATFPCGAFLIISNGGRVVGGGEAPVADGEEQGTPCPLEPDDGGAGRDARKALSLARAALRAVHYVGEVLEKTHTDRWGKEERAFFNQWLADVASPDGLLASIEGSRVALAREREDLAPDGGPGDGGDGVRGQVHPQGDAGVARDGDTPDGETAVGDTGDAGRLESQYLHHCLICDKVIEDMRRSVCDECVTVKRDPPG